MFGPASGTPGGQDRAGAHSPTSCSWWVRAAWQPAWAGGREGDTWLHNRYQQYQLPTIPAAPRWPPWQAGRQNRRQAITRTMKGSDMEISLGNKQLHENKHSQRHSQSSTTHHSDYRNESNKLRPGAVCTLKKPSSWDGAMTLPGHMCDSVCVVGVGPGYFWNTWISFDLISSWISFPCSWNLSLEKKKLHFYLPGREETVSQKRRRISLGLL